DLDGVLIDSEGEYSRIWATVNSEYPTGIPDLEVKIKGCTLDKILNDYYPDQMIRQKVVRRLYELEGKMHYEYLPGAYKLLSELKNKHCPTAMVTSSNDDKMRHLDEELPNIRNFFDTIVTADQIKKSKPDPEGYLKGAKLLNRDIRLCVVFEDSLQGVKAGYAAGAFVVGVAGTLAREVLAPYSDIVVDNLSEIDLNDLIRQIDAKQ
ncbi:MAG: HAD family phosphatase, partial [Muribaculaceae bacterium]|nr:HAD family phosphatase [Muribaculaceae bacterium]